MEKAAISIIFVICFGAIASGYPGEAPKDLCDHLRPGHDKYQPQTTKFEYKAIPSKTTIKPSERIDIVIKGPKQFKGFVIVVKDGNEPVGRFNVKPDHPYAKLFNCNKNEANAASHKNINLKNEVHLTWIAPQHITNRQLDIYLTVLETYDVFWTNHLGGVINVEH